MIQTGDTAPYTLFTKILLCLKVLCMHCMCACVCVCAPACMYMCANAHECRCPQRPEKGVGFSGSGVTGSCEPPDGGAGNKTWVLFKSSQ